MLCLHLSGFKSPTLIDDGLPHVRSTLAGFWTGFFFQNVFSCFVLVPLLVGNQVCRWDGQELQSSGLCENGSAGSVPR